MNTNQAISADYFAGFEGDEYASDRQVHPFAQVVNNQGGDVSKSGIFVSLDNAEKVGLSPESEDWQIQELRFGENTNAGYLTRSPKLFLIRQSDLGLYDRDSGNFLGHYERDKYNRSIHVLKTKYLILFADGAGKPLHETPLQLTAKGAFGAGFGQELGSFRNEINTLAKAQKGQKFFALWLFIPKLELQLKGTERNKSWVTTVTGHVAATPENIALFRGRDEATAPLVLRLFDESEAFGKHSDKAIADDWEGTEPETPAPPRAVPNFEDIPF